MECNACIYWLAGYSWETTRQQIAVLEHLYNMIVLGLCVGVNTRSSWQQTPQTDRFLSSIPLTLFLFSSSGLKLIISKAVPPLRWQRTTALSSLKTTLQTLWHGLVSSLKNRPVWISHTFARPSFPPDKMNRWSNCRHVTELSWAHKRSRQFIVARLNTMIRPSEPPVVRISSVSWSWPTSDVWPWRRAIHSLRVSLVFSRTDTGAGRTHPVLADQTRMVESALPATILRPSKATA